MIVDTLQKSRLLHSRLNIFFILQNIYIWLVLHFILSSRPNMFLVFPKCARKGPLSPKKICEKVHFLPKSSPPSHQNPDLATGLGPLGTNSECSQTIPQFGENEWYSWLTPEGSTWQCCSSSHKKCTYLLCNLALFQAITFGSRKKIS